MQQATGQGIGNETNILFLKPKPEAETFNYLMSLEPWQGWDGLMAVTGRLLEIQDPDARISQILRYSDNWFATQLTSPICSLQGLQQSTVSHLDSLPKHCCVVIEMVTPLTLRGAAFGSNVL